MRSRQPLVVTAAVLIALLLALAAREIVAQEKYPNRPVDFIVP